MKGHEMIAVKGNLVFIVGWQCKVLEFADKDAAQKWCIGSGLQKVRFQHVADRFPAYA